MRLIDADDFMKKLLSVKRINKGSPLLDDDPEINNYDVGQEETFDLIIRKLSERPTAYDVEKVVEQLEEMFKHHSATKTVKRLVIEIVKGGGVNED